MEALVDQQLAAQLAGDPEAAVAVYTDSVEANTSAVSVGQEGLRAKPFLLRGRDEAQYYYECTFENVRTDALVPVRSYYGEEFCVTEHAWHGAVMGHFHFVTPDGGGRRVTSPLVNIWEFRDGLISRHNMWWDSIGITAQLVASQQLPIPDYRRAEAGYVERVGETTSRPEMDDLIQQHLAAIAANDTYGAVETLTADVEYDVVAFHRVGLLRGPSAVRLMLECRSGQFERDLWAPVRTYYGQDFCVTQQSWTSSVRGHFLAVADGEGQRVSDSMLLTVWEFRDGLISRHNVWLDAIGVIAQLTRHQPLQETAKQIRAWASGQRIGERAVRQAVDRMVSGSRALTPAV
jgi:hypothetical protein